MELVHEAERVRSIQLVLNYHEDMKAMGIKEEMAQDRCAWRNITGGPTRASADA